MRGPHGEDLPGAILFAFTMNSVRSVMAMAIMKHLFGKFVYIDAAGVRAGELDPMAVEVMDELGIEIGKYHPKTFEDMEDSSMFDLCVTLSPEAQHRAVGLAHTAPSRSNTARPWIPPSSRAAATSASTPTALPATAS